MKAVLIAVIGLLAVSVKAQNSCNIPKYTQDIVPTCLSNLRVQLPSYSDPSSFYQCSTGKPVLTKCPSQMPYFCYVYQQCTTCANYIPAVECSALKGVKCQPISATSPPPTPGPVTPTTATTPRTTTPRTTTPAGTTTPRIPRPPVDSTLPSGGTTPSYGDDTTIYVPGPPGPNNPDIPQPPSPPPTVGTIATGPPEEA